MPLYGEMGDVYQSLNSGGSYILSKDIFDDYGQNFGSASGTEDLVYQWRGSSGYRSDGDGLWTGSYNEPLIEVGARYYLVSMGVFITRDKNLKQRPYEYCNADPVNNVDPTGYAPGDGLINLSKYIEPLPTPASNNTVPAITMQPNSGFTFGQGTGNSGNSVTSPGIPLPDGTAVSLTDTLPNEFGGSITNSGVSAGVNYGFGGSGTTGTVTFGTGVQFSITGGSGAPVFQLSYPLTAF